jgi:hypothetical protein
MTAELSTTIGSRPSLGTPPPGTSTLAPSSVSTSGRASFDSTSVPTRPPKATASGLGITSKPAVTKGKGLVLGAKKTSLADALAAEMEGELGDAWGEGSAGTTGTGNTESRRANGWSSQGDLMDLNADQDDWSEQIS